MTRYEWVADRKAEKFPIKAACNVADVSVSSFNDWRRHQTAEPTKKELAEAEIVAEIRNIETEFDGTYGVPRMTPELRRRGHCVNHKRVARLMAVNGIAGIHKPAKPRTTIASEDNPPIPDRVNRCFEPREPDWAWCGDITYIRTGEGWLYLASVIDIGSRRFLGYSMASRMKASLVVDALDMAAAARGGDTEGIIFHHDRGGQYMGDDMAKAAKRHRVKQSAGRTGVCWDNSLAESAWSSLKRELVHRYSFRTRAEARRAIFGWITRYNSLRLHSSLGYVTPMEWEDRYNRGSVVQLAA